VKGSPRAPHRFWLGATFAAILSVAATPAMADLTKDQCIDANAKAQDLRRDGKLSLAREQLRKCIAPSCPTIVRSDCTKRLDDLENAQPTIAFVVKDATGSDVTAVKVTVDGDPLADRLGGSALPVDPGEHVFTFTVASQPPVTRKLVVTEGEKGRREVITLGAAASPTPTPTPKPTPSPATPTPTPSQESAAPQSEPAPEGGGMGTQKILGLVAGGFGVAGIAVGSVFGMMTLSQKSQQQSDCGSTATCTPAGRSQAVNDHSSGMTDSTISTVGFIAGGALLVGGVVLFFTAGPSSQQPSGAGLLLAPSVGPGGAGMLLRGEF